MKIVSISTYKRLLEKLQDESVAFLEYCAGLTDEEKLKQHDYIMSQQARLRIKRKKIDSFYELYSKQVLGLFPLKKD